MVLSAFALRIQRSSMFGSLVHFIYWLAWTDQLAFLSCDGQPARALTTVCWQTVERQNNIPHVEYCMSVWYFYLRYPKDTFSFEYSK